MPDFSFDEAKELCLQALDKGERVVEITGPVAAGRRQLLRELQEQLAPHRTCAYLEVPEEAFDSGALGLAQVGRCSQNGALKTCQDPHRLFVDKVKSVVDSLPDKTVLFLFAPWFPKGKSAAVKRSFWRLRDLLTAVEERFQLVAVAPNLGPCRRIRISHWQPPAHWIDEFAATPLEPHASSLLARTWGNSRLELRLAVGLSALQSSSHEAEKLLEEGYCLPQLLQHLAAQSSSWLKEAWQVLSLARKPVLDGSSGQAGGASFAALYRLLGEPAPLESAILRHCLGFVRGGMFELHERVQRAGRNLEEVSLEKLRHWHHWLGQCHQLWYDLGQQSGQPWLAFERELHVQYHHIESGELPRQVTFQDQWAMAGRYLSQRKLYREAIDCYQRALELDPSDAYSHHYLAYNRSQLPKVYSFSEIQEPYQRAIELDPDNLYWYPRFVCWLLERGQFARAHQFWGRALKETDGLRGEETYYDQLHRMVFRAAIFRDIELSRQIVDDIPHRVRTIDRFRRMRLLYQLAVLALDGLDVVPTTVVAITPNMRLLGPHLTPSQFRGQPRQSWYSARVEEASEEEVCLFCGSSRAGASQPDYFTQVLTRGEFEVMVHYCEFSELQPGRFVEVADYGTAQVLEIHSDEPLNLRNILDEPVDLG